MSIYDGDRDDEGMSIGPSYADPEPSQSIGAPDLTAGGGEGPGMSEGSPDSNLANLSLPDVATEKEKGWWDRVKTFFAGGFGSLKSLGIAALASIFVDLGVFAVGGVKALTDEMRQEAVDRLMATNPNMTLTEAQQYVAEGERLAADSVGRANQDVGGGMGEDLPAGYTAPPPPSTTSAAGEGQPGGGGLYTNDPHGLNQYLDNAEGEMDEFTQGVTAAKDLASGRQETLWGKWDDFIARYDDIGASLLDDWDTVNTRWEEQRLQAGVDYGQVRSQFDEDIESIPSMSVKLPTMLGGAEVPIAPGAWRSHYTGLADTRSGLLDKKFGVQSDALTGEANAVTGKGRQAAQNASTEAGALGNQEVITTNDLVGTVDALTKAKLPLDWAFQMMMADKAGGYGLEQAKMNQSDDPNVIDKFAGPLAYVMANYGSSS